jgi:hypothetical protein
MTAKEKAHELFDKYNELLSVHVFNGNFDIAKQCAILSVDEIINSNPHSNPFNTTIYSTMDYWQEVKTELENL